jgi:hypothetical protein
MVLAAIVMWNVYELSRHPQQREKVRGNDCVLTKCRAKGAAAAVSGGAAMLVWSMHELSRHLQQRVHVWCLHVGTCRAAAWTAGVKQTEYQCSHADGERLRAQQAPVAAEEGGLHSGKEGGGQAVGSMGCDGSGDGTSSSG